MRLKRIDLRFDGIEVGRQFGFQVGAQDAERGQIVHAVAGKRLLHHEKNWIWTWMSSSVRSRCAPSSPCARLMRRNSSRERLVQDLARRLPRLADSGRHGDVVPTVAMKCSS